MAAGFFSPNKSVTGGCAFFSFNSKDGSVFVKLLKQVANNIDKKGNFDGKNALNIKLTEDEAAGFIRAVRTCGRCSFFHKSEKGDTQITFNHYVIKPKTPEEKERQGYGLTVKRGAQEIKVGFTMDAAERLSEYMKFALTHIFSADYSADLKAHKENMAKKAAQGGGEVQKEPEAEKVPESQSDDEVF